MGFLMLIGFSGIPLLILRASDLVTQFILKRAGRPGRAQIGRLALKLAISAQLLLMCYPLEGFLWYFFSVRSTVISSALGIAALVGFALILASVVLGAVGWGRCRFSAAACSHSQEHLAATRAIRLGYLSIILWSVISLCMTIILI